MNSSKKLNSQEILQTYGITKFDNADKALAGTPYKRIGFEFDKNAVIHWFMGLPVAPSARGVSSMKTWISAAKSLFLYISIKGWMKNCQANICYRPFRRHPIQDQINEIEHWSASISPTTTNYGISSVVPVWDRNARERHPLDIVIHNIDGADIIELANSVGGGKYLDNMKFYDIFDAVHYIRDNMYVDANPYIQRSHITGDYFYNLENARQNTEIDEEPEDEEPEDAF